jgi:hypothetical protein
MSAVTIDRLVLEIPGMDAAAARALAVGIAESLAAAGGNGDLRQVSLTLDPPNGEAPGALAARIAAAVLQRIG